MKRALGFVTVLLMVMTMTILPALAASEEGHKSCSTDAHVYTKAVWKSHYYTWIDNNADGNREVFRSDTNGGVWETDYANAYGWSSVVTSLNSGYYKIYGTSLDTWSSWPGCEAD